MPLLPKYVRNENGKYVYRRTYRRSDGSRRNFRRELGVSARQMRLALPSVIDEFEDERNARPRSECTLREFAEMWFVEWVDVRRTGIGPDLARMRVRRMCDFTPGKGRICLGDHPLCDIGARELLLLRGWLVSRGLSSQTIIHYFRDLHCLYGYAEEEGGIDPGTNPIRPKKLYPKLQRVLPRAVLNHKRIDSICENAKGWLLCILVARWTGQRWGDCRRLRWEHVRIEKLLVGFEVGKNGQTLWLPIPVSFAAALEVELERQGDGAGVVLPNAPKYARDFTRTIVRRVGFHFSIHDLRRFRTSELLEFGVGAEIIRQALRWSSVQMVYRYGRVPEAHVLKEIQSTFDEKKVSKRCQ